MSKIARFFAWFAGANMDVLDDERCKHEQHRYALFGALGLFIGAWAAVSAFLTASLFTNTLIAVALSAFWGAFITLIERAVMQGIAHHRKGGGWRRGAVVLVRLVLAGAVGFAITTGLSLKFFETSIDRWIAQTNIGELNKATTRLDSLNGTELQSLRAERTRLQATVASLDSSVKSAFSVMEAEGTGRRSGRTGAGELWRADSAFLAEQQQRLAELRPQVEERLRDNQSRIDGLTADRTNALNGVRQMQRSGVSDRLRALYELEKSDAAIAFESLVFLMFCLVVDLTPALVKLLSGERDAYEALIEMKRVLAIAASDLAADEAALHAEHDLIRARIAEQAITDFYMQRFVTALMEEAKNTTVLSANDDVATAAADALRRGARRQRRTESYAARTGAEKIAEKMGDNIAAMKREERSFRDVVGEFVDSARRRLAAFVAVHGPHVTDRKPMPSPAGGPAS